MSPDIEPRNEVKSVCAKRGFRPYTQHPLRQHLHTSPGHIQVTQGHLTYIPGSMTGADRHTGSPGLYIHRIQGQVIKPTHTQVTYKLTPRLIQAS